MLALDIRLRSVQLQTADYHSGSAALKLLLQQVQLQMGHTPQGGAVAAVPAMRLRSPCRWRWPQLRLLVALVQLRPARSCRPHRLQLLPAITSIRCSQRMVLQLRKAVVCLLPRSLQRADPVIAAFR